MKILKLLEKIIPYYYVEEKIQDKPAKNIVKNSSEEKPPLDALDTSSIKNLAAVLGRADQNPDQILKLKGVAIYDDMEAKDTHIYAVYQTRKLALATIPWEILPADNSPRSKEIADFVFTTIDDCRGTFSEDIKQLLDAIGKGFSILEIKWRLNDKGKWKGKFGIEELLFHKQKYWFFKDNRWHKSEESIVLFGDGNMDGKPVPWEKIIHYAYDAEDNLYGRAAFKPCYWFYYFKKEGWKSWVVFLNKYGTPTATGEYPAGTKPADQTKLLQIVESIQEETGIIFPTGMKIAFLEATHAGTVSYKDLSDACNAEISKAILGATQTVEEGRRGSYALSRAHSQVRRERVEADAIEISDVFQHQLVKRLVDFNFITDIYPQFVMKYAKTVETPIPVKKAPAEKPAEGPAEGPAEKPTEKTPAKISVKTPALSPPTEEIELLQQPLKKIKKSVLQSWRRGKKPVINVGSLKNALSEKFGEEKAFELAKNAKTYIEENIEVANIDEVFDEVFGNLREDVLKNE